MIPALDILIPTIPQRHEKLCRLLKQLDAQAQRGVGVIIFRDDPAGEDSLTNGEKMRRLIEASTADYVCCVDDDDLVAPDYVARILAALADGPDYVGFPVAYSLDLVPQAAVEHSLRYDRWFEKPGMLCRDISHLNPMRRELALLGNWLEALPGNPPGGHGADRVWAQSIRETGLCRTEVWIPDVMYHYLNSSQDNFYTARDLMPVWPAIPSYSWLTAL